ncbi:MAG: IclR family transcriptional regulator [Pseudomonadota bacterium]
MKTIKTNQSSDASNKAKPSDTAGSLNRSLILINAIARGSRKGSLLTELVARTGLPRPTIHRILAMLMQIGWVEKDEKTARFNLGLDLAALGYCAILRNPIERIASTELSRLADDLKQLVYLGVRSGLDMVCIGRYESQSQIMVGKGWVGQRGPLGMSMSCMAMFAKMPPNEVQAIIQANMARYHRIEGFDENGFHQTLKLTMQTGYGTYDNIILDRTTSGFGVAILDASGYPIATIGTTYITGWLTEEQKKICVEKLNQAAANISEALLGQYQYSDR